MKRQVLTSPWLESWKPTTITEIADRTTRGLVVRCGPLGRKTFYAWASERTPEGKIRRRRLRLGEWPMTSLDAARKMVASRHERPGQAAYTATVGALLDLFIERGQTSDYTAALLRKHLEPIRGATAATLAPVVLSDLVAKVQAGYQDEQGRTIGGPAVADKVRGGLRSLFGWAQRQGRFPVDRPLPTLGLVRGDFKGIGWKPRERRPSEHELHQLLDALGVGTGPELAIDLKVSPRIPLATRLAVLALMHVPVRSGVGLLAQPRSAVDLKAGVLRWHTRKGERDEDLELPLSAVAREILGRLAELPGGAEWLVPSPENPVKPDPKYPPRAMDEKTLARLLKRLQGPGPNGEDPRVGPDKGEEPFVVHVFRALWASLAGDLGIHDGVAVRVLGHKPEGASAAQRFYDHSARVDLQREAVERVSAELERIRRRLPREAAAVVSMATRDRVAR